MIALWLLYAAAVGLLASAAAAALERLLRLWRLPLRGVWAAAMLVTLLAPLAVLLRPAPAADATVVAGAAVPVGPATMVAEEEPSLVTLALAARTALLRAADDAVLRLAPLDRPLVAGWALASALLLVALGRSVAQLRRHRRRWERRTVDGHEVLVAPDTGPAVIGAGPARVVLPAWALELDRPLRALVLRHETEHLRAGDPHLLLAGVVALVATPWNPALWWQLGRLRLAVELDCDRRVLAAHGDVERYGLLLMAVGQRAGGLLRLATPALSEPTRDLERRITAMTARPPRRRLPQAAALVTLAALGAAVACVVPSPNQVSGPGNAPTPSAQVARPVETNENTTYFEFQVEQPAVALNNASPNYPAALQSQGIGGQVIAQFVVDTSGMVDVGTFKVLESSHEQFTAAVREALPQMRFTAAQVGGRKVKQLVQQPFAFGAGGVTAMPVLIPQPAGTRLRRPAAPGEAPSPPPDAATLPSKRPAPAANRPYFEAGMEGAAELLEGGRVAYPSELAAAGVRGQVIAQFVINADGTVDTRTLKVIRSDHELFTAAVRATLPSMRFKPAQVDGRAVRQLFQQVFVFDAGQ